MLSIIHEDEDILIVVKPAGLPVFSTKDNNTSLARELARLCPRLAAIPEQGIAHRLDNDTSGLVCVGGTCAAYENLRAQFSGDRIVKKYSTLVCGVPPDRGTIDAPIAHHPRKKNKMIVCESESRARELKARPAHTEFEVRTRYEYRPKTTATSYTLLEVRITTGMRHQIRAHLAWQGYPLAGDKLYQNPRAQSDDTLPLARFFLHARRIELTHPVSGAHMVFECTHPAEANRMLKLLVEV